MEDCCKLNTQPKFRQRVVLNLSYYYVEWTATLHDEKGKKLHEEKGVVEIKNRDRLKEYENQARQEGITALEIAEQELLDQPLIKFE